MIHKKQNILLIAGLALIKQILSRPLLSGSAFLLLVPPLNGFRPDALSGSDIMEEHLSRYRVEQRVNLIKWVSVETDGTVKTYEALNLFQKEGPLHKTLLRVLSPEAVNGVTLMSIQDFELGKTSQYLLMPAVGKVVEIRGSGYRQRFMGTDFTFEDLLSENPGDYNYKRLYDVKYEEHLCVLIEATPGTPRIRAMSGYSKRVLWLDKDDYRLLKVDYYDRSDKLLKTLEFNNFEEEEIDGKTIAIARQAQMKHHPRQTASMLVRTKVKYNALENLEVFTPEIMQNWPDDLTHKLLD